MAAKIAIYTFWHPVDLSKLQQMDDFHADVQHGTYLETNYAQQNYEMCHCSLEVASVEIIGCLIYNSSETDSHCS